MKRGMRLLVAFILLFVTVFANVRIVKADPAPNGEGVFFIRYDGWWIDNEPTASVSANGTILQPDDSMAFNANEEIIFSFTVPESRAGYTPFISVHNEEYCYETWSEGDNKLELSDDRNSFSFTPPNNKNFWVEFSWSEYDFFGPAEDEFMIETKAYDGTITADLSGISDVRTIDEPNSLGGKKQIFKKSELTTNSVTFTFAPDENRRLNDIEFWVDDPIEPKSFRYSLRNDPDRVRINSDNGFSEENGIFTYKFDFSGYDTSRINVNAGFDEIRNEMKENKFFVEYDEWVKWDNTQEKNIQKAFVKNGNEILHSFRYDKDEPYYDYTVGKEITFSLAEPEERKGCTPIVEIETGLGEWLSSASGGITLREDNTFSFTPSDKYGFRVNVQWSDYDRLWAEDNSQLMLQTYGEGGSVTVDLSKVEIICSMDEPNGGSGKKQIIKKSDITNKLKNEIEFSFTPDENRRLWNIDFDMEGLNERFCLGVDEFGNSKRINADNGFKEDNGVYTYSLKIPQNDSNFLNVNAWFDDPQESWIKENSYYVEYDERKWRDEENGEEIQHAFVKRGEETLVRYDYEEEKPLYEYTIGESITFTLVKPEEREDDTPIVEIETGLGERYSSKADRVDQEHLIKISKDNKFKFTPKDKYGFRVNVEWSEYDSFWYEEDHEFLVRTEYWNVEQGEVTVNKKADSWMQEGGGRTAVKRVYSNDVLDETEPFLIIIKPEEGHHVRSVDLSINKPGNGSDYIYVNRDPDPYNPVEKYLFEEGSGFSRDGDIVYYTVPKDAKSANVWMTVNFSESHDDIKVNSHGRKVQYRIDNGKYKALPDNNTIKQNEFENANTIQFKFSKLNGNEKGVQVITYYDDYAECWRRSLEENGTYTIDKNSFGGTWKGFELELFDWDMPLDDQYMLDWFGPEGEMNEKSGLEENTAYDMPESGTIKFSFSKPVYKVVAEPNWQEPKEIFADKNGVYSYTPDTNVSLIFRVYSNEEEYKFFEETNPESEDQFVIEYEENISDYNIPGVGGTVSYGNVKTVKTGEVSEEVKKYEFIRNRKRIILDGQVADSLNDKLTFTITPNIGCDYQVWIWDQEITDQVKKNKNKFELDLSNRDEVPRFCVSFFKGNTPLSGTVTINGKAKYGETLTASVTGEVNEEALKYQWYRGDKAIKGATGTTYKTVKEDLAKVVSCKVTSELQKGTLSGQTSKAIEKADGSAAPVGLGSVATSKAGVADGKITGVSVLMEYATKSDFSDKKSCYGTVVMGLTAGTYYVRTKETDTAFEGAFATVTVENGNDVTQKTQEELVRDFVERFYTVILDRPSEPDGLQNWTVALMAGTRGGADVADEFIHSKEYQLKNESDDVYITKLYWAFFNREPDDKGFNSWKKYLADGHSRDDVLNGFLVSQEYKELCERYGIKRDSTRTFTKRFYKIIMGRTDDLITPAELDLWQTALDAKALTGSKMTREWINDTPEFQARQLSDEEYVKLLYNVIFNRDADPSGLKNWTDKLNSGMTRAEVLDEILVQPEFNDLCASYGIDP